MGEKVYWLRRDMVEKGNVIEDIHAIYWRAKP